VGGGVRGGPFHSQNPEMAFFHTPGLKIVYPATARDAKGLLKAAIRDDDPVLFFEHKKLYRAPFLREVLEPDAPPIPLGSARLHRAGADLTIVTYGMMVHESQKAADQLLEDSGIDVEIIDLRTLLPLDDAAIIDSVKKTNRVLIVHEDTRTGGIAGEIGMRISEHAFEWLDAPVLRVTAIDTPVPYSPPLEDYYLPNTGDIVAAARYLAAY
jgi:pyruvate/2-oxoglutarate/acetoin dehydrogenase E1 component